MQHQKNRNWTTKTVQQKNQLDPNGEPPQANHNNGKTCYQQTDSKPTFSQVNLIQLWDENNVNMFQMWRRKCIQNDLHFHDPTKETTGICNHVPNAHKHA